MLEALERIGVTHLEFERNPKGTQLTFFDRKGKFQGEFPEDLLLLVQETMEAKAKELDSNYLHCIVASGKYQTKK